MSELTLAYKLKFVLITYMSSLASTELTMIAVGGEIGEGEMRRGCKT
jgi:hypothetical protein